MKVLVIPACKSWVGNFPIDSLNDIMQIISSDICQNMDIANSGSTVKCHFLCWNAFVLVYFGMFQICVAIFTVFSLEYGLPLTKFSNYFAALKSSKLIFS